MKLSDYIALIVFGTFGFWWMAFPKSVIRFYGWFHSGKVKVPPTSGIRFAGVLWIILVSIVIFFGKGR
jgi:hypothetical protein